MRYQFAPVAQITERPASNRGVAGEIPAGSTNLQWASDGNSAYLASSNLAACRCKSGLAHQFAPMTGTSIPHWLKPSGMPVQLWLGAPISERTRIVSFPHRFAKPASGNGLRGQHPSSPPVSARGVKQHSAAYNRGRTRSVPGAGASPAAPTKLPPSSMSRISDFQSEEASASLAGGATSGR